jgi:hypothetical protein
MIRAVSANVSTNEILVMPAQLDRAVQFAIIYAAKFIRQGSQSIVLAGDRQFDRAS